MSKAKGQQRLMAFYEKPKSGENEMKQAGKEVEEKVNKEDFSDKNQGKEDKTMEWEQDDKGEEKEKKEEEQPSTTKAGKRNGKEKESPKKKQQKMETEKSERKQERKRGNATPNKSKAKGNKQEEDETTPERNNHAKYNHVHISRITVKLKVQGQKDMKAGMMKLLKEYLVEMKKADPNLQIYPWKEGEDRTKPRLKTESDLTDLAVMQATYGKGFFVFRNQGTMRLYPKIRIGHDSSIEDIREETREWARANECNIFKDRLQYEKTTQVGWFCYTTRNFDTESLGDVIAKTVGFQVDLQWRMIATGKKGKVSEEQKAYALHVEVEDKGGQKYEYMNRLIKKFGRNLHAIGSNPPNGVRMRFVKLMRDAISTKEKAKLNCLRIRQKKFNAVIMTEETDKIEELDYCTNEEEPTLREMIMEIRSEKYKDTPIFFSVDADWRGRGHVFSFSLKMEEEATIMIRTLLPFLKFQYPDDPVEEYFTEEAIRRCKGMTVDPNTGRVKQLYEEEFDEDEEDEMLGFDLQIDTAKAIATLTRLDKSRATPSPEDDDSVSTLGGAARASGAASTSGTSNTSTVFKPRHIPTQIKNKDRANNDDISVISATSTVTMQTIATLEAKLDENVSAINSKLNLLVSKLFNEETSEGTASVPKISSSRTETVKEAGGEEDSSGKELQH